jgi:hypothetical protein
MIMRPSPRPPLVLPALLGAAAALLGLTACGDVGATCGPGTMEIDGACVPDVTCGEGTHAEGGMCVADSQCGAGTVLDAASGQCVPDGSVICPQGTTFEDGQCQLDPDACAEGTVLVDGQCVLEDDALMADVEEAAEPNDDRATPAGTVALGAIDASTVIHGCIDPRVDEDMDGNLDADFDVWLVTTAAPATIEVTADGVHGLVAGFVMLSGDPALDAQLGNWRRFGINLTSDTARRQVYLPAAGTYALLMSDARSLLLGAAGAGGSSACYFTTIKRIATPAPVPLTLPQTMASDAGQVKRYSFSAPTEGRLLTVFQSSGSSVMFPAFVVLRGPQGALTASVRDSGSYHSVGGLAMNEQVIIVSDMEYNWGLTPQDYTYDVVDIDAVPLPAGGSVTLPKRNGLTANAPFADYNYLYFDVAGSGTIVNFTVTGATTASPPVPLPLDMAITRRDVFNAGDLVALIEPFGGSGRSDGFSNEFVRFDQPGRYYFIVQDPVGTSGDTYTLSASYATAPVSAATLGTPLANQALPASRNAFHTLDLTNPVWLQFGITGTGFPAGATGAQLLFYDLSGSGWLSTIGGTGSPNYVAAFTSQQNPDGTTPVGRIMARDTKDYLVRVRANGAPGASPTYTLDARNRDHHDFMTITPGTPIMRVGMDDVPAATGATPATFGRRRFIVSGAMAGNSLTALVTPTNGLADIQLQRLDVDESSGGTAVNLGAAGAAETLAAAFGAQPTDWVAFEVQNRTVGQSTNLSLRLDSVMPRPYTSTMGAIAYADVCPTGVTLGTNIDDEYMARRALPAGWSFQLFGEPVTHYVIAGNGFIKMGDATVANPTCALGCYQNQVVPLSSTDGANGIIAPFWTDLEGTTICVKEEATKVTVQWAGHEWGAPPKVAMQVSFHMNGVIDFVYGPSAAHESTGREGTTIGLENLGGSFGHQFHYAQYATGNTPVDTANTSRVLTPAP